MLTKRFKDYRSGMKWKWTEQSEEKRVKRKGIEWGQRDSMVVALPSSLCHVLVNGTTWLLHLKLKWLCHHVGPSLPKGKFPKSA